MFNSLYGRKSAVYAPRESQTLINLDNELGREGTGFLVLNDLFLQNVLVLRKGEVLMLHIAGLMFRGQKCL